MGQTASCGCNPFVDNEELRKANMAKYVYEGSQVDRITKKGTKSNTEPLINKGDVNHKSKKQNLSIKDVDTDDGSNSFVSPRSDDNDDKVKTAPRLNSFTTTDPWDEDYESMDQDEVDMHQEMAQLTNYLSGRPSPQSNDGDEDIDQLRKSMKSHKRSLSNKLSSE